MKKRVVAVFLVGIVTLALGATIRAIRITYVTQEEDQVLRTASDNPMVSVLETMGYTGDGRIYLCVKNTHIDYQLAQANAQLGNDFYLSHDYDGNQTSIGCPFVDYRTSANAQHVLVYAHGNANSTILFSELKQAHTQEVFQTIGTATLTLSDGTQCIYRPLMAMSVKDDYQAIQNFSFSQQELTRWLKGLCEDANVCAPNIERAISQVNHVLTLVTCTSPFAGQPERTLIIFGC